MSTEADRRAGRVLEAMTLLSVASTAFDLAHKQSEKRAGRDPTTLESVPSVHEYLFRSFNPVREMLGQVKINAILDPAEGSDAAALAHCFHLGMLLAHIENQFSVIHQKLMSLFPDIDAALVERARKMVVLAGHLADDSAFSMSDIMEFANKGFQFISTLENRIAIANK